MALTPTQFAAFESRGEITRAELYDRRGGFPVVGGLACPRIWPPGDAGGLGHIDVPSGVVHPARPDVILRRVPVVPPADRPLQDMPGGAKLPDAVGRAYARLLRRARITSRLEELDAPEILIDAQRRLLQETFEVLVAALDGAPRDAWAACDVVFEPPPDPSAWAQEDDELPARWSCAFLGAGDDVIIADGTHVTWGASSRLAAPGLRIYATSDDGALVLFTHVALTSYHLLDLERGEWLAAPARGFPRALMREEHEEAFVVDAAGGRERRAEELADYPAINAASPDGRFLWIADKEGGGGVYDVTTGELAADPALEGDDDDDDDAPLAFALAARDQRWRFACGTRVMDLDGKILRRLGEVAGTPLAVAFDRSGARLLAVTRRGPVVVDV